jgi:hypothetical protein
LGLSEETGEQNPAALQAAARQNKKYKNWYKSEYLAGFAKLMVRLYFKLALHPTLHSQNLLLRVNGEGRLLGFVLRDMHDMMFDPYMRLLLGKKPHMKPLENIGTSRLNELSLISALEKPSVGEVFSKAVWQALFIDSSIPRRDQWETFLSYFLKELDEQVGIEVRLPFEDLCKLPPQEVLQAISDRVREWMAPPFEEEDFAYDQSLLHSIFHFRDSYWQVALGFSNSRKKVDQAARDPSAFRYAFDGKNIWLVSPTRWKATAVAYELSPIDLRRIRESTLSPYTCVRALKTAR